MSLSLFGFSALLSRLDRFVSALRYYFPERKFYVETLFSQGLRSREEHTFVL
jgi:hypothetical protein